MRRAQRSFFGQFVTVAPCPTCKGDGQIIESQCRKCRGDGRIRGEKTIKVAIPAGVATGQYMTMRGVGNAAPRGGERGDVHVIFDVADDPRFERDGEDLYTEVLVTYPQLVLGATIEVPTVTSSVALSDPVRDAEWTALPPAWPRPRARELERHGRSARSHPALDAAEARAEEHQLIERLRKVQQAVPADRGKGFWAKMKEALGA